MLYITDLPFFVHGNVTYMWYGKSEVRDQRGMNCYVATPKINFRICGSMHHKPILL